MPYSIMIKNWVPFVSRQLQVRHQLKNLLKRQIRQQTSSSKNIRISALYGDISDTEPDISGTPEELLKAEIQNCLAIPRLSADEMD